MAQGIGEGMTSAFNMFMGMQRNRNAREANELRAQQQAQSNALRRQELGVARTNAATNRMNAGSNSRNAASNAQNAQTTADRLDFDEAVKQWEQQKDIQGINQDAQGGYFGQLQTDGYVDASGAPTEKFKQLLSSNPDEAARIAGQASELAQPDRLPPGVRIIGADNQIRPGSVVLRTSGPAGDGAITQNATSAANDPVAPINEGTLLTTFSRDLKSIERSVFSGDRGLARAAAFGVGQKTRDAAQDREDQLQEVLLGNLYAQASDGNPAPRAAARQLEGILNDPNTSREDRRQILIEQAEGFGIQVPEELMNPSAASDTPSATEEVILDKNTQRLVKQLDNQIEMLETRADSMTSSAEKRKSMEENLADLYSKRDEIIADSNAKAFKEVDADLLAAQQQLKTARPGRKTYWQGEVDRLTDLRASAIKQGTATTTTTSEGWSQLEDEVFAFIEGKTPEQIRAALDAGEITLSPTAVSAMEKRVKEAGVTTLQMANNLPDDEELLLRATMAVVMPDESQRKKASEMLSNSADLGVRSDMGVEAFKARIEMGKTRSEKSTREFADANTARIKLLEDFTTAIQDPESNIDYLQAAVNAGSQAIAKLDLYRTNPAAQSQIFLGMNSVLSETISRMGQEGFGTPLWSKVTNFFAPDPTTGLLDVDLEKVVANDPKNPTAIYSIDGGRQRGDQISLSGLESALGSELAGIIERAAVRNAKARQRN